MDELFHVCFCLFAAATVLTAYICSAHSHPVLHVAIWSIFPKCHPASRPLWPKFSLVPLSHPIFPCLRQVAHTSWDLDRSNCFLKSNVFSVMHPARSFTFSWHLFSGTYIKYCLRLLSLAQLHSHLEIKTVFPLSCFESQWCFANNRPLKNVFSWIPCTCEFHFPASAVIKNEREIHDNAIHSTIAKMLRK